MTPWINVNLKPCEHPLAHAAGLLHTCSAEPIPLPCPIPRSVMFQVALGECTCAASGLDQRAKEKNPESRYRFAHNPACPARPIRVACSIAGATWEESAVDDDDIEIAQGQHAVHWRDSAEKAHAVAACQERWALVKALVTGAPLLAVANVSTSRGVPLAKQLDAVYAALAEMARMEDGVRAASIALFSALKAADPERVNVEGPGSYAMNWSDARPNAEAGLAAYVSILAEQIGACAP